MSVPVVDVLLPLALAFIMFALGLTLVPADFARLLARPKAVTAGLLGQMVLVPALAWGVALAWGLPPEMAAGLVILAACPGGASSGLITYLARGETALSITLTAVTSLAAVLSVPLVVNMGLQHFLGAAAAVDLPVGRIVRGVFIITTVPVALGMLMRVWRPRWVERMEKPAGKVATLLFLAIVVATFVSQREALWANLPTVGPAAAALNLGVMLGGAGLARLLRLGRRDAVAIATECGLQNAALGIFVAGTVLAQPALAVPSVVYALLMNVGALGLVWWGRRQPAPLAAA